MKKVLKFTMITCICCMMTLIASACAIPKSRTMVDKDEWENAFTYNGKYKITTEYEDNLTPEYTSTMYVHNNKAKQVIMEAGEEYTFYYSFDGENWWRYYYNEELEEWELFEYPQEYIDSLIAYKFVDFEDVSYDTISNSYKVEDVTIGFMGSSDELFAHCIEYIFYNKKLVKVNLTITINDEDLGEVTVSFGVNFSYDDNFTITLPNDDANGDNNSGLSENGLVTASEWADAFAYTGKHKMTTIYEVPGNYMYGEWYIEGNKAKEIINQNGYISTSYYSFVGEYWWWYYYSDENEQWEIFENPFEKNKVESLYTFGLMLDYEDVTYDTSSKSYKAQNTEIDYFGYPMLAENIEYVFNNKKLVKINLTMNDGDSTTTTFSIDFSYVDDFTIILPDAI